MNEIISTHVIRKRMYTLTSCTYQTQQGEVSQVFAVACVWAVHTPVVLVSVHCSLDGTWGSRS